MADTNFIISKEISGELEKLIHFSLYAHAQAMLIHEHRDFEHLPLPQQIALTALADFTTEAMKSANKITDYLEEIAV